MKTNIFKYLKFLTSAAFSYAVIFSAAFGACATNVNVGGKGMSNVGSLAGVTSISGLETNVMDETSAVSVKHSKYFSLFKPVTVSPVYSNRTVIDNILDNSTLQLAAFPLSLITQNNSTGKSLGSRASIVSNHKAVCDLIDYQPLSEVTHAENTIYASPDSANEFNIFKWASSWASQQTNGVANNVIWTGLTNNDRMVAASTSEGLFATWAHALHTSNTNSLPFGESMCSTNDCQPGADAYVYSAWSINDDELMKWNDLMLYTYRALGSVISKDPKIWVHTGSYIDRSDGAHSRQDKAHIHAHYADQTVQKKLAAPYSHLKSAAIFDQVYLFCEEKPSS